MSDPAVEDFIQPGGHDQQGTLQCLANVTSRQRLAQGTEDVLTDLADLLNARIPGLIPGNTREWVRQRLLQGKAAHRWAVETMIEELESDINENRARKVHLPA